MLEQASRQPVDYLAMGHLAVDLTPSGPRLGGTVTYAALTARALGLRAGIVTASAKNPNDEFSSSDDLLASLDGISIVSVPSEHNTTFENIPFETGRRQVLHHQAAPISFDAVPTEWRQAPIVHIGPIAQELTVELPETFTSSFIGVTPQGWMRTWDSDGRIQPCVWKDAESFLPRVGAVVFSREDVGGDEEQIERMAHAVRVLAVTENSAGVRLYWHGDQRRFRAPKVMEVDSTGAGDVFAAAFFFRMYTTRDPWEAARFATQLASCSVTRTGLEGIPTQQEIQESLMEVLS
jgi:sugar/nucleoside kinase (ribokinase family)